VIPQVCWILALLKGDLDELNANETYKRFYMQPRRSLAGHGRTRCGRFYRVGGEWP